MDRVRFGRVLGKGVRMAARTALEAADAATAPDPRPASSLRSLSTRSAPASAQPRSPAPTIHVPSASVTRAAIAAGRSGFAAPFRRASHALWREVTGGFFALFALSFAVGAWRTYTAGHASGPGILEERRFLVFCLMALLFGYFSVSNFVRARRVT